MLAQVGTALGVAAVGFAIIGVCGCAMMFAKFFRGFSPDVVHGSARIDDEMNILILVDSNCAWLLGIESHTHHYVEWSWSLSGSLDHVESKQRCGMEWGIFKQTSY